MTLYLLRHIKRKLIKILNMLTYHPCILLETSLIIFIVFRFLLFYFSWPLDLHSSSLFFSEAALSPGISGEFYGASLDCLIEFLILSLSIQSKASTCLFLSSLITIYVLAKLRPSKKISISSHFIVIPTKQEMIMNELISLIMNSI